MVFFVISAVAAPSIDSMVYGTDGCCYVILLLTFMSVLCCCSTLCRFVCDDDGEDDDADDDGYWNIMCILMGPWSFIVWWIL